jgi:hypothetical protein
MRFKRLRAFVGIFLVLFVLVVGNIIAFGLLQKYNISDDDSKMIAPIYTINKPDTPTTNSQQQPSNVASAPTSAPAPSPAPTVVHTTVRTRAS